MKIQKKHRQHLLAMRQQLAREKGLIAVRDAAKALGVTAIRTEGLKAVRLGTLRLVEWAQVRARYPVELNLPKTAVEALARVVS